ncbi:hypothetical protein P4237_07815 [Pseudomonas aeruginosa]|nr:hypothetical protein [Pseudomonas aeruginosa]
MFMAYLAPLVMWVTASVVRDGVQPAAVLPDSSGLALQWREHCRAQVAAVAGFLGKVHLLGQFGQQAAQHLGRRLGDLAVALGELQGGVGRQTHRQLDHRSLLARQRPAGVDQAFGELGDLVAMFLGFLLCHCASRVASCCSRSSRLALALIRARLRSRWSCPAGLRDEESCLAAHSEAPSDGVTVPCALCIGGRGCCGVDAFYCGFENDAPGYWRRG